MLRSGMPGASDAWKEGNPYEKGVICNQILEGKKLEQKFLGKR